MLGKVGAQHATDWLAADPPLDHAVVIEHRDAICCQPDIALESRGPELECQFECGQGVLWSVGARSSMGERDWRVEARWETLLH